MVVQPFSKLLGLILLVSGITLTSCTIGAVNNSSSQSTSTDAVPPSDSSAPLTPSGEKSPSPEVASVIKPSPQTDDHSTADDNPTAADDLTASKDTTPSTDSEDNSSETAIESPAPHFSAEDHLDTFLYQYYDLINQRQYQQAWARLGDNMRASSSYDSYVEWWNSVQRVDVEAISQIYAGEEAGSALVQVSYDKSNGASSSEVLLINLESNPSSPSESEPDASPSESESESQEPSNTSNDTDSAASSDKATPDPDKHWLIQKVDPAVSVAPTRTETPTTLTPAADLVLNGIGPIRVGMTLKEAANAAGLHFATQGVYGPGADCDYYQALGAPHGVSFMVSGDRIVRVDVDTPDITTPSGAGIGSSIEDIKALYPGKIEESGHQYVPDGKYLRFVPEDSADQRYRLLFETDETGTVTRFRSGFTDEVGYVEGCS